MKSRIIHNDDVNDHLTQVLSSLVNRMMAQCQLLGLEPQTEKIRIPSIDKPAGAKAEKLTRTGDNAPVETPRFANASEVFQTMIDEMPHFVLGFDSNGRCIASNAAFKNFLKALEMEPGDGVMDALIVSDSAGSSISMQQIMRHAAATGMWTGELYLRKSDNEPNCFQASFFHLEMPLVTDLEFAGILININQQKRMEQDFIQTEVMRSIGMLAGGVAHNLNNLLVGVMGYASLLKPHLKKDKKLQKYITMIENSSSKAAELTRQLLTFSQRGDSTPIQLDVNDAIKIAVSLVRKMINRQIELDIEYAKEPCLILADPADLEHIILQLSVNAADAMKEAGHLLIKASPVSLSEEFVAQYPKCEPGPYVQLIFTDTGHGIPKEIMKDIFHPFYTTREFAHRGMGLSSVYGLVQRYRGAITVHSVEKEGTTFEVYLPRFIPEEKKARQPSGNGKNNTQKKTLLIVDDEKMVLDFFASVLEHEPYQLLFAENGMDALEIFKKDPDDIDLIFMDMIMPRKNGLETYNEMIKIRPDINVIFSSGFTLDYDLTQLIGKGRVGFLRKPFDLNQFLEKLREATS